MSTATEMKHRQAMVNGCNWSIAHRSEIHYGEIRPMPIHTSINHGFTTDCSGFVTLMAKWGGCSDPNGLNFDGQGYTGTMIKHLPHIPFKQTLRGDLLVIGAYPGIHVVALLEDGHRSPRLTRACGTSAWPAGRPRSRSRPPRPA